MTDNRPAPKPRKYPQLWQAYLLWEELMLMRQRHTLRLSAIEAGKSNLDDTFERGIMEGRLTVTYANGKVKKYEMFNAARVLREVEKVMIGFGQQHPVWEWMTSIKGLGAGSQAAKVLAMIDDIDKFDSIAKLWRYCGYGLYEYYTEDGKVQAPKDGKKRIGEGEDRRSVAHETTPKDGWQIETVRDRAIAKWVLPYNKALKSALFIVGDQFIKQQTPYYAELYYAEKQRQRTLYPEPVKVNGRTMYTDMHIHRRAMRKMIKEFLKNLWVEWRQAEGLPTSEAWS